VTAVELRVDLIVAKRFDFCVMFQSFNDLPNLAGNPVQKMLYGNGCFDSSGQNNDFCRKTTDLGQRFLDPRHVYFGSGQHFLAQNQHFLLHKSSWYSAPPWVNNTN